MSDGRRKHPAHRRKSLLGFIVATALAVTCLDLPLAAAEEASWDLLRDGGHVALIRHARAPGVGDPPGFRIEDCATQRNLSPEGRAQAVALGEAFRRHGVAVDRVLSSRWCRSLETAQLAFGTVEPFEPLDSFFQNRAVAEAQTAAVRALIRDWPMDGGTLVLVTHQVNITALTEIFPAEGEVVVLRAGDDDGIEVVGRIAAIP